MWFEKRYFACVMKHSVSFDCSFVVSMKVNIGLVLLTLSVKGSPIEQFNQDIGAAQQLVQSTTDLLGSIYTKTDLIFTEKAKNEVELFGVMGYMRSEREFLASRIEGPITDCEILETAFEKLPVVTLTIKNKLDKVIDSPGLHWMGRQTPFLAGGFQPEKFIRKSIQARFGKS